MKKKEEREAPPPVCDVGKHRRCWAFTQEEVAILLDYEDPSSVSRIERGKRLPSLRNALALEALFGVAPKDMFPVLYRDTEEALLLRAYPLYEATLHSSMPAATRKRELLDMAMQRATKPSKHKGV